MEREVTISKKELTIHNVLSYNYLTHKLLYITPVNFRKYNMFLAQGFQWCGYSLIWSFKKAQTFFQLLYKTAFKTVCSMLQNNIHFNNHLESWDIFEFETLCALTCSRCWQKGWRIHRRGSVPLCGTLVDRYVMCERMVAPLGTLLGIILGAATLLHLCQKRDN